MKFLIKTSAVGISDKKFAQHGEYETEDKKEIERLRDIAKRFPDDVEEIKGKAETPKQNSPKKDEDENHDDPQDSDDTDPKDELKKTDIKPTQIAKK